MITNQNFSKVVKYILVIVITLLILGGCGKETSNDVEYLIGVSHADLSRDCQFSLEEEIKEEIDKYDAVKIITMNANGSTFKQIKDLQTLRDYGIDLLIVTPNDAQFMKREIKKIYEEIPVIVMNREVSGDDYTLFIGPDFFDVGKMVGESVLIASEGLPINVIELKGPIEYISVEKMSKGFREAIKVNNFSTIQSDYITAWSKDEAKEAYSTYLERKVSFDYIYTHGYNLAKGVMDVNNTEGIENITCYTSEALDSNIKDDENLFTDGLQGIVTWQLGGVEAVAYAVDILKGKTDIPKDIVLNNYVLNEATKDDFLNREHKIIAVDELHIGVIQSSFGDWDMAQMESIESAIENHNMTLHMRRIDPDLSNARQHQLQKEAIYNLMDEEVDAIILNSDIVEGWQDVFNDAKRNNTPIIVINNPIDVANDLNTMFIGYEGRTEGILMGNWIIERLYDGNDLNMLVIASDELGEVQQMRMNGIQKIINNYSGIRVINDWSEKQIDVKSIIHNNRSFFNTLLILDESKIESTIDALLEEDLTPGEDVILLCYGDEKTYDDYFKSGKITSMVSRKAETGILIIESIIKIISNPYSPKAIYNSNEIMWNEVKMQVYE